MTITKKHLLPIALVIAGLYLAYTRYFVPYTAGSMPVKELLTRYSKGGPVDAAMAERALLRRAREDQSVIPDLLIAMTHPDQQVRSLAAAALGETRAKTNGDVVRALLKALDDSRSVVKASAASAFRKIRVYEAIEPLIVALDDPSADVRSQAHAALKSITRFTWAARRDQWTDWWKEAKGKFYVMEE